MRLGDLDALKKAIDKFFQENLRESIGLNALNMIIDNAPTVKNYKNVIDAYNAGYIDGKKIARPQGKWIPRLHASENDIFVCSVCKRELGYDPSYCPNCGADMRGDSAYGR